MNRRRNQQTKNNKANTRIAPSVHPHLAAMPVPRGTGIVAYLTPEGTTVIRFRVWTIIVRRAASLPLQKRASFLQQKAQELEERFGHLKELWKRRLRKMLLRRRLLRLSRRWDAKDECVRLHNAVSEETTNFSPPQHGVRAPPENGVDALKIVSSLLWLTPSTPRAKNAPPAPLRVAS